MFEAKKKILDKWNSHPLYEKALENLYLNMFVQYSLYDKRKALKYLRYAMLNIWDKRVIRGMIRLLLPILFVEPIKHLKNIVIRGH